MRGLVIKSTGSSYIVRMDDGTNVECRIKGNFRIRGIRSTNPVAVGDFVEVKSQISNLQSQIDEEVVHEKLPSHIYAYRPICGLFHLLRRRRTELSVCRDGGGDVAARDALRIFLYAGVGEKEFLLCLLRHDLRHYPGNCLFRQHDDPVCIL